MLKPIRPTVRQSSIPPAFVWIIDSAANTHIQPYHERFSSYTPFTCPQIITGVYLTTVTALGTGSVILTDNEQNHFSVQDVLYVPSARLPILSMIKLQRQGLLTRPLGDTFILSTTNRSFWLLAQTHDNVIRVAESFQGRPSYGLTALLTTRRQAAEQAAAEAQMQLEIDSDSSQTTPSSSPPPDSHNAQDNGQRTRSFPEYMWSDLLPVPRINAQPSQDFPTQTRSTKRQRTKQQL